MSFEKDISKVTAAILAGGLGSRLRPVIPGKAKALASIWGRPFLAYLLDQLMAFKIRRVVLCTGYLGDQVEAALGDCYGSVELIYSREAAPLGTGGALRCALPLFRSDPVLIMNGDTYARVDLRDFGNWHFGQEAKATLFLTKSADGERYGQVRVQKDGRIQGFHEKGPRERSAWINGGLYLIRQELLRMIPPGREVSLEKDMFPAWVREDLYGYCREAPFLDIGVPEAYQGAERLLRSLGICDPPLPLKTRAENGGTDDYM